MSALDDLRLSQKALDASAEAVKQFEQAVADQRDKLHEGVGTVIDLVLTEELLIIGAAEPNRRISCAAPSRWRGCSSRWAALPTSEGAAASTLGRLAWAPARSNAGGRMQDNKVFRQAVLDRLASPEQLHTLMQVTDAKGWLALLGCGVLLATAVVWGVLGRIPTKVEASGILLYSGGLADIVALGQGQISRSKSRSATPSARGR